MTFDMDLTKGINSEYVQIPFADRMEHFIADVVMLCCRKGERNRFVELAVHIFAEQMTVEK